MFCRRIFVLVLLWKSYIASTQNNDEVDPIVTCPGFVNTSTASNHASAKWSVTVTDNIDTGLTPTCVPPSGSQFSVGETAVTCAATDDSGNVGNCTFNVYTAVDRVNPNLECPSDITAGTNQPVVNWSPPKVTDNLAINLVAICTPSTGSSFGFGSNQVTCVATDVAGNDGSCTFVVYVIDDTLPTLECSDDLYVGVSPNHDTTPVAWMYPIVTDNVDSVLVPVCRRYTPQSAITTSPISLTRGSYNLVCTVHDNAGNMGSCSFVIIVLEDSSSPSLSCPDDIHVSSSEPAIVTWNDPTVGDNIDIGLTASCTRSSGSLFNPGQTTVYCYSTDHANNIGNCTFKVTISDTDDGKNNDDNGDVIENDNPGGNGDDSSLNWSLIIVSIIPCIILLLVVPIALRLYSSNKKQQQALIDKSGNSTANCQQLGLDNMAEYASLHRDSQYYMNVVDSRLIKSPGVVTIRPVGNSEEPRITTNSVNPIRPAEPSPFADCLYYSTTIAEPSLSIQS
ncbi:hyalin-like [Antedon mediterranea]|uniref:hyalin-like n=1 Tax=Antedon mediterranea TaxID=105859 RepID=UPI003AF69952